MTSFTPKIKPLALLAALHLAACGDNISPAAGGLEIAGFVWNDSDGNGVFDADEEPIAGARVYLDANDNQFAEANELQELTDSRGFFRFEKLPPGEYLVRQSLEFGWRASSGTGLARVQPEPSKASTAPSRSHIIGGSDALDRAYPFMASVGGREGSFSPFCGASLISDRFILTAAHCSEGAEPEDVSVMLGTNDPSEAGVRVNVRAIHVHPDYEGNVEAGFDMAVWELAERLDLNTADLHTVEMLSPAIRDLAQEGALATTIGWGVSDNASDRLQEVHLPIVSEDQCALSYPQVRDFETQICAGSARGGLDSCQGDSGGPLLVRDSERQQWMHAGITSWGDGCALAGKPGIYGRTSAMFSWAHSLLSESSATYQVSLTRRDVELEFPNQATTRPFIEELAPRWSISAMELAGVSDGAINAGTSFQVRFFLFGDPEAVDQEFSCSIDLDGAGSLDSDSFDCKAGTNSIRVGGYPDGLFLPALAVDSSGRSQSRSELVRSGEPTSTEVTGSLSITDSTDVDYPSGSYFIDYFTVEEAETGTAVLLEMESSFGGQLGLYDAALRSDAGGGALRIDSGGLNTSIFFVPEEGRQYLIGVSSTGTQATGSYTLRLVNSGTATPTTL